MAETIELKKFLTQYYRQLHFNAMPVEVRAQFDEWIKNDTLTDTMKLWRDKCMHVQDGKWVSNEILDPADKLSDGDLEKLYGILQRAISGMAANKSSFADTNPSAMEFLGDYFGSIFTVAKATSEVEEAIQQDMLPLLDGNDGIKAYVLNNAVNEEGKKIFADNAELKKFIEDVEAGKYNTDAKIQTKVQTVAQLLSNAVGWYSSFDSSSDEYTRISRVKGKLDKIIADNAFSNVTMPSEFKAPKGNNMFYAGHILKRLYEDKQVFAEFSKYDGGKISKEITKARDFSKWNIKDDENYVPPKRDDQLNFLQQVEKTVSDKYSDCLKKYVKMRGDHLFFKTEAKDICKAIDKVGIKPTSGLPALLDKANDIAGKIKNPVAKQDFKWFTETMTEIKNAMPKAVEGCWRNPTQMKAVLQEIMIKAVSDSRNDPHAIEKAKTAMEIMTVMKYGLVSSRTMEALKDANFSMFGDDKLSWNKTEGVQFVTKAFDKGIKAAFLGIGYSVVFVGNAIRMRNKNFTQKDNQQNGDNDERGKRMAQYITDEQQYQNDRRTMANKRDDLKIQQEQKKLGPDYTPTTIDTRRAELANATAIAKDPTYKADYEAVKNAKERETAYADLQTQERDLKATFNKLNTIDIPKKQQEITDKQTEIDIAIANGAAPVVGPRLDAEMQQLNKELTKLTDQLHDARVKLNGSPAKSTVAAIEGVTAKIARLTPGHVADTGIIARLGARVTTYENAVKQQTDLENKIKQYEEATDKVEELNNAINRRKSTMGQWNDEYMNRFYELENYWNYLQTGKASNFWGKLSTKAAQKRFDQNKDQWLQEFISEQGITH